jgi:hypothetical protein
VSQYEKELGSQYQAPSAFTPVSLRVVRQKKFLILCLGAKSGRPTFSVRDPYVGHLNRIEGKAAREKIQ